MQDTQYGWLSVVHRFEAVCIALSQAEPDQDDELLRGHPARRLLTRMLALDEEFPAEESRERTEVAVLQLLHKYTPDGDTLTLIRLP